MVVFAFYRCSEAVGCPNSSCKEADDVKHQVGTEMFDLPHCAAVGGIGYVLSSIFRGLRPDEIEDVVGILDELAAILEENLRTTSADLIVLDDDMLGQARGVDFKAKLVAGGTELEENRSRSEADDATDDVGIHAVVDGDFGGEGVGMKVPLSLRGERRG